MTNDLRRSLTSLPPWLITLGLPEAEKEWAESVGRALSALEDYTKQFAAALLLFDNCEEQEKALTRAARGAALDRPTLDKIKIYRDWEAIAARDGALTIYDFDQAKDALHKELTHAPTIVSMIDMDALKAAEEMFVEAFPLAKETRHAISHLEEAKNRLCEIKRHGVGRAAGVRGFVYANNLSGRSYSTMWKGTIVCYELSKATLDNLAKVRDAYFEVFRSAERATKKAADAFRSRVRE